MFRYPAKRMEYCKKVGQVRVDNILLALNEMSFLTHSFPIERKGVDIMVSDQPGNLLLVIEVTNWRITSKCYDKKLESINNVFATYSCGKLLIVSFYENIENVVDQIDESIDILVLGFQTQPNQEYYDYYQGQEIFSCMAVDSPVTYQILKKKLVNKLKEMQIL